ncbi:MAG: hypothetical protein QXU32_11285 [Nitrososphaerales archaeon]
MEQVGKRVCAWCDAEIEEGSLCTDCMTKYNITMYDSTDDGCGCDTK